MKDSPLILNRHIFFLWRPVALWLCLAEKTISGFFVGLIDELTQYGSLLTGRTMLLDRRENGFFFFGRKVKVRKNRFCNAGTSFVMGSSGGILFCTSDVMEKGSAVDQFAGTV